MDQLQIKDPVRKINTPLLILIILSIIVGGVIYFYQRKINKEIEKTAESFMVSSPAAAQRKAAADETASWNTYKNEVLGIEFKYPSNLLAEEVYTDYTNNAQKDLAGKSIETAFIKTDSTIGFAFGWHSSDYKAKNFLGFVGSDNISARCKKPLEYSDKGKACKIINMGSGSAIFENELWELNQWVGLGTRFYFNNQKSSQYKGLEFFTSLEDASNKVKSAYKISDLSRAYREAQVQSMNIMNGVNLSEKDKKALDIFNKVISTFEYIK